MYKKIRIGENTTLEYQDGKVCLSTVVKRKPPFYIDFEEVELESAKKLFWLALVEYTAFWDEEPH